jgi:hypothetical protein
MGDPKPNRPSARSAGVLPVQKPRWAFWKGLLAGAAIEIPLVALTVWALARLGVGNPDVELMRIVRLTTVFAGPAALLTAGGIGRLAADALVEVGRRRAVLRAVRAHAVAGAGLVLIAAIPHGHLPGHSYAWLAFPAGGLACGAIAGALIGFVCSSQTSLVGLSDVWSLARRPRVALRNLLDPDDIVRLGSALRTRTTNLFEGIFDPAPLPPKPAAEPAPPARSEGAAEPAGPAPAPAPAGGPRTDA